MIPTRCGRGSRVERKGRNKLMDQVAGFSDLLGGSMHSQHMLYRRAARVALSLLLASLVVFALLAAASALDLERSLEASSARWSALGEYYTTRYEAAAAASSARYSALADHYNARYEAAALASSARYQALAEFYGAGGYPSVAAGVDASSARWSALGAYYAQRYYEATATASSARYTALAKYYIADGYDIPTLICCVDEDGQSP
jgi:hypothetical protein